MTDEEYFKNHVAKLTDYGDVKILDFKNPDTVSYAIRFMFDEVQCVLCISGDLGELVASNYNNMTYEGFNDFVKSPYYFISKIDCHSRNLYEYNEGDARTELKERIEDEDITDDILEDFDSVDDFLDDVLEDYRYDDGISQRGYDVASRYISDFFEIASGVGRKSSGIIELYLTAFRLAKAQIDERRGE